jgi:protein tyrosine/serine phosphatase
MASVVRWPYGILGTAMCFFIVGGPLLYQRYRLTTWKRLRVVVPDRLYRSGQMTAAGFEDAIRRLGIRTVINVQNEYPDPLLRQSFLCSQKVSERDLCAKLGVRYIYLEPDLIPLKDTPSQRPQVIDPLLSLLDDERNYPILIHCKAGLHRTGVLVALYRREYQSWSAMQALEELKQHGFGDDAATAANLYVKQYILDYLPRSERQNEDRGKTRSLVRGTQ